MNYKDEGVLRDESDEGRRLGFDGKVRRLMDLKVQLQADVLRRSKRYIPSRLTSSIAHSLQLRKVPQYPFSRRVSNSSRY